MQLSSSFGEDRKTTTQFWTSSSSSATLPPTPKSELTRPSAQDPSTLLSPPGGTLDDMHASNPLPDMVIPSGKVSAGGQRVRDLPSPPVSPCAKPADDRLSFVSRDVILFPHVEPASPPAGPLFPPVSEPLHTMDRLGAVEEQVMDEHIAARPLGLFRAVSPPSRDDYRKVLYFRSECLKMFSKDPRAYLRRERELLRSDRKTMAEVSRPHVRLPPILPAARSQALGVQHRVFQVPRPQVPRAPVSRVQKPKTSPKIKSQNPRPLRVSPTPTRPTIHVHTTPEPPRIRTVAPSREDKDFASLEDLSPPLSTLPLRPNSLKVDWKGNALDLRNDPHRHLLHPDELQLASSLRLDCATYLTSKRRIFISRLECARRGKEFRKTDAQQACKIDVNKASKLWQAFEKVGWLDLKWVQGYLARGPGH
ncbi:SWIRM domain-containing protein FUN19 [Podospora australis]|uniref:SWIRM domain-containing protein FUN19 n=1 Tax=Podospora australis TaxID=1536484 RepID=A0AAN7AM83_9PEZI|nr:SWIRM domain-containing protein FUN19 [Podospora australis]